MGPVSIKMYDKFALILRIETTANDVSFFKHYREVEHRDGSRETKWASMQKTIYSFPAMRSFSAASAFPMNANDYSEEVDLAFRRSFDPWSVPRFIRCSFDLWKRFRNPFEAEGARGVAVIVTGEAMIIAGPGGNLARQVCDGAFFRRGLLNQNKG